MYYAQKQFLVTARFVNEDEWLSTDYGEYLIKKGNIILTDYYGNSFPTTPFFFKEDYIPVSLVKREIDIEKMARGYIEMSKLSQEEDGDYINRLKNKINE